MIPPTTIYNKEANKFEKPFNIGYRLGGKNYVIRIHATDWGHAEQHLGAIIEGGQVLGEIMLEETPK
jgi:hypothetical protein